jgi:DNA-binding MarR family transcriptional regulator
MGAAVVRVNTLSTAVEAMRAACPRLTLRQAILFLYACENEGLSMHELAFVSRVSDQTTSRGVRMLASHDPERLPAPLLSLRRHPDDKRVLLISLTARGAALKAQINAAIEARRAVALKSAA